MVIFIPTGHFSKLKDVLDTENQTNSMDLIEAMGELDDERVGRDEIRKVGRGSHVCRVPVITRRYI